MSLQHRAERRLDRDRPGDQRAEFQRDRDRVLYSREFRRLAGVTQVVGADEGHLFHNRLTHSLKVAQVGRRIAEHLLSTTKTDEIEAAGGLDADVVETACLAHDIGHPPFGHVAEEELDAIWREKVPDADAADGFEGNAQSFRIVTNLSIRHADLLGLNLTRASLNAILKYPHIKRDDREGGRKWGYYHGTERDDFDFAREHEEVEDRRSLEAEIMDRADDITYSVHDVDDFYQAGLVPLDQILQPSAERDRFVDQALQRVILNAEDREWAEETFLTKLGQLAPDELKAPFAGTRRQRAALSSFTSMLIRRFVLGEGEARPALRVVADAKERRVQIEEVGAKEVKLLKGLMKVYVFEHPGLMAQQFGHRRMTRRLFEILFDAAHTGSKDSGIVPEPFRGILPEVGDLPGRARLVTDLISSLTERQALLLFARLQGYTPGSIHDSIVR